MVRPVSTRAIEHPESIALFVGLFISVVALVALCAKRNRRIPKVQEKEPATTRVARKRPLASPRHLVGAISNKANASAITTKGNAEYEIGGDHDKGSEGSEEGGLWRKAILMGDKCRPPEFSGAIYYDSHGNQLPEPPKSPRAASPLRSFLVSVAKE
ncbi:uncharacterized protein LOC115755551 [Rhodamnia argentea]|uniref:Uncharacterized protein LOC115755551 n=1 Tax=Rhodamnia argentea TaxID=178133 RepID=A0A8B8QX20_9MYRT|nr:uncharacterized protein LOC115755551 [Rhodamnia argentea]